MRPRSNTEKAMATCIVLAFAVAICAAAAAIAVGAQDSISKRDCFASAGRVERYDADRPQVWRCVGARPEAQ